MMIRLIWILALASFFPENPLRLSLGSSFVSESFNAASVNTSARPGGQSDPAVAWAGETGLVVWYDDSSTPRGLHATRINSDGDRLDALDILVSDPLRPPGRPAVFSNGTNFLVSWVSYQAPSIFAVRVEKDGTVFPLPEISIDAFSRPSITAIGSDYIMVWQGAVDSHDIEGFPTRSPVLYGAIIRDLEVVQVFGPSITALNPAIAVNASHELLLVFQGIGEIRAARISQTGEIIDTTPLTLGSGTEPKAAATGDTFTIAWISEERPGERLVNAGQVRTVSGRLTRVDSGTTTVLPASTFPRTIDLISNGARCLVAGSTYSNIVGRWLDTFGADAYFTIQTSRYSVDISLSVDGNARFWGAWQRGASPSSDVITSLIQNSGPVTPNKLLTTAKGKHSPKAAFNGENYFLVWEDWRDFDATGQTAIYGGRVTASGKLLDPNGILIAHENNPHSCDCAALGGDFVCAWQTKAPNGTEGIFAARIGPDGILKDPGGVAVIGGKQNSGFFSDLVIAANGSSAMVAFFTWTNGSGFIRAAPIENRSGQLAIQSPFNVFEVPPSGLNGLALAARGESFLLAWAESIPTSDIYCHLISSDGSYVSPQTEVCLASGKQRLPRIAATDSGFIVAWQDEREGKTNIYFTTVSPDGIPNQIGGSPIVNDPIERTSPVIKSNGDRTLLTWQEWSSDGQSISYHGREFTHGGPASGQLFITGAVLPQNAPALESAQYGTWIFVAENVPAVDTLAGFLISDLPRLDPPVLGDGFLTLRWRGEPGQKYQVEYEEDLKSNAWIATGLPILATEMPNVQTVDLAPNAQARFFRLVQTQ
jgi:hypothetical protein